MDTSAVLGLVGVAIVGLFFVRWARQWKLDDRKSRELSEALHQKIKRYHDEQRRQP